MQRSASLPLELPREMIPNPWWSERAQMEHALARLRPRDLPGDLEAEGDSAPEESRAIRGRASVRARSSSPSVRTGALRSEFRSPSDQAPGTWFEVAFSQRRVRVREEGERHDALEQEEGVLERELEREMVDLLRQKNQELKAEMEAMKRSLRSRNQELRLEVENLRRRVQQNTSSVGWSEVSYEDAVPAPPPPPPPRTPRFDTSDQGRMEKLTPASTRIPPGPPPEDPMPPTGSLPWPCPVPSTHEVEQSGLCGASHLSHGSAEFRKGCVRCTVRYIDSILKGILVSLFHHHGTGEMLKVIGHPGTREKRFGLGLMGTVEKGMSIGLKCTGDKTISELTGTKVSGVACRSLGNAEDATRPSAVTPEEKDLEITSQVKSRRGAL